MNITERRTRPDRTMAIIVATGIAMSATDGRRVAAAFLESERVPFRVIVRVLEGTGLLRDVRM